MRAGAPSATSARTRLADLGDRPQRARVADDDQAILVGTDELAERRRELDDAASERRDERKARIDLPRFLQGPDRRLAHAEQQQAARGRGLSGERHVALALRCAHLGFAVLHLRERDALHTVVQLARALQRIASELDRRPSRLRQRALLQVVALRLAERGTLDHEQRVAALHGIAGAYANLGDAAVDWRAHARHRALREREVAWSRNRGPQRLLLGLRRR
jgi:hypothetical protein